MANLLQERYSNMVLARLRASLVTKDNVIFNTQYEGNPKAGAVKVPTRAEVTVGDYNKASGITGTTSDTTYVTLTIDKDKAVNEVIDGYDASAVPDGIVADRLDSAGYGLANDMDKKSIAILETGATVIATKTASTKSNIFSSIVDAGQTLDEANVPVTGRYLIVPPSTRALLIKSDEFIKASDLGQEILITGAIGQINGFNVYMSNNCMKDDTTITPGKKTTTEFIAGHPMCASRVMEWQVPVHVQDLNGSGSYIGASAVQGRQIWGAKVTHKAGLLLKVVEATE